MLPAFILTPNFAWAERQFYQRAEESRSQNASSAGTPAPPGASAAHKGGAATRILGTTHRGGESRSVQVLPSASADSAGELCPATLISATLPTPPRDPRIPSPCPQPAGIHLGRPRPLATAAPPPPSLAGPWKHRERPREPAAPRPRGMAVPAALRAPGGAAPPRGAPLPAGMCLPVRAIPAQLRSTQRFLASGSSLFSTGWWPSGFALKSKECSHAIIPNLHQLGSRLSQ